MNSISQTLVYFDRDYLLLEQKQKLDILTTIILYTFRLCESTEMMEVIFKHLNWTGQQGIDFRKILQGKGSIQKCMKFYIYDRVIYSKIKADPSKFGVTEDDADFVRRLLKLRHKNVRFLKRALEQLNHNEFPPRSMDSFERGLALVVPELEVNIAKYVNKKFRFLWQSGQVDKENLQGDMRQFALYSIYRAYPEIENRLHMKNIGIRALHNRGVNILKEQSTQKRKRMIQNEDGTFSGTLLSFSHPGLEASMNTDFTTGGNINVCNHLMVGMRGQSVVYERPNDVERQEDLKRTVEQVSDKLRGTSPKTFLSLLMGQYNRKFSDWLGKPNDEACDTMDPKEYAEKCRAYLKVPKPEARKLVLTLREHLRDFQN
jgi:hypothetical protein